MNTSKPFNASQQSQDDYCKDCANVCACNVILKDGETCGDRIEDIPEGMTPEEWDALPATDRDTARGLDELTRLPDPDEEAADFDRQVQECLNHWPGITAVDLY